MEVFNRPNGAAKESITRYEVLDKMGNLYLLKVEPITGRPHQIRAQLQAFGCPILGDLKYGAREALPDASIALHCRSMEFVHPVRLDRMFLEAPLPEKEWWTKTSLRMANAE